MYRWLVFPLMQAELDQWRMLINDSKKEPNKKSLLPQGIPSRIFRKPQKYGGLNFGVRALSDPNSPLI